MGLPKVASDMNPASSNKLSMSELALEWRERQESSLGGSPMTTTPRSHPSSVILVGLCMLWGKRAVGAAWVCVDTCAAGGRVWGSASCSWGRVGAREGEVAVGIVSLEVGWGRGCGMLVGP